MGFPWILQRYILREMSKTFLLTAVALTGVLGLGGGVMNMIKLGDVTTGQLFRLMSIVLPIAAALTLPIAALFSAAATYGRLSADNEFVACRSSGINMHILFLPTLALSLLSATFTFGLISFVIPRMVRNLNEFVGADIGALIERRLQRPRGITLKKQFRIHADGSNVDRKDGNLISLHGVSFIKTTGDDWTLIGSAREVLLEFEQGDEGYRAAVSLFDISAFDHVEGQFFEQERLDLFSDRIPLSVPEEIKFLTLRQLIYYSARPMEWREARAAVKELRMAVGRRRIYHDFWEAWRQSRKLMLEGYGIEYDIRSELGALRPDDGGIDLYDVTVLETSRRGDQQAGLSVRYKAERGLVEVKRGSTIDECEVMVELFDVEVTDGPRTFSRGRQKLTAVPIRGAMISGIKALSPADLVLYDSDEEPESPIRIAQAHVREATAETIRRIAATIGERFAFSVSVFVLVILGAALGVIFRGAHAITAFGVSFAPSLFVIITIVMGKQMAYNASTPILGLLVMWSGIAVVAGLDAWTLTKVLRR